MRIALALLVLTGCAHSLAKNEVEAKSEAKKTAGWKAKVGAATFCQKCGAGPLVKIELGTPAKAVLSISSCYAHAHSVLGDHDAIKVERMDSAEAPKAATLDIVDCSTQHVTASLSAVWPDGLHLAAKIDTDLAHAPDAK